jgi:hypothetical protein
VCVCFLKKQRSRAETLLARPKQPPQHTMGNKGSSVAQKLKFKVKKDAPGAAKPEIAKEPEKRNEPSGLNLEEYPKRMRMVDED